MPPLEPNVQILPLRLRAEQCVAKKITFILLKQMFRNGIRASLKIFSNDQNAFDEPCVTRAEQYECPLWAISGHDDSSAACPLYPRKQISFATIVKSALCQKRPRESVAHFSTAPPLSAQSLNPPRL
jgi:hypothetical protein